MLHDLFSVRYVTLLGCLCTSAMIFDLAIIWLARILTVCLGEGNGNRMRSFNIHLARLTPQLAEVWKRNTCQVRPKVGREEDE